MDMELTGSEQLAADHTAKTPEGASSSADASTGAGPGAGAVEVLQTHSEPGIKRTGRPVHPLWAHFHRGEKRNRYHYHAFCSYCVARHGIGHVAPTRGVSSDMLRHLESCSNCPRKVVEELKELCDQRERQALAKKKAGHPHSHGTNAEDHNATLQAGEAGMASSESEQQRLLAVVPAKRSANEASLTVGGNGDTSASVDNTSVFMMDAGHLHASETGRSNGSKAQRGPSGSRQPPRASMDASIGYLASPAKRGRTGSHSAPDASVLAGETDLPAAWKVRLLQATVVAGLPLSVFQKTEFQELLRLVTPEAQNGENGASISSIGTDDFLTDTALGLARGQLDRVKEGMLNSTIKGGLTLSVTYWRTLDLQQLVAFALVNSNGDASCVRVVDLGSQQPHAAELGDEDEDSPTTLLLPLVAAIEDVLLELQGQNICVMGVVADSAVVLSAARRVCRSPRWHALLVVPCLSALLASLAGSVLTFEAFREVVGQLVEVAAYFSNDHLLGALRAVSGDPSARIPLPRRDNWFSFLACLGTVLHFSDAITAVCSGEMERSGGNSDGAVASVPSALRDVVLSGDGQFWKTLRDLDVLLAPLREAHSLVFQPKIKVGEENVDESGFSATVHGGLTLAHVMYQLGRMSQQYSALAHGTDFNSCADVNAAAHRLHALLDAMWQRYDLPVMVLAFVFDFHLDTARLDMSSSALQWKAIASYFQVYFQRWFGQSSHVGSESTHVNADSSALLTPIQSDKMEEILNAYQLRQFPFDADTTSDYTDVSSFYSFVSDSHPEICALCCRVYAVALATADIKRIVRGIGFVPTIAQTTERPKKVELLLHVGFASSLKKLKPPVGGHLLTDLTQVNHPEELICGQEDWEAFATDWRSLLDRELEVDELEQMQRFHESVKPDARSAGETRSEAEAGAGASHADKDGETLEAAEDLHLPLDQLFFDALPPLPAARVVVRSPHDSSGRVTHAVVNL